MESTVLGRDVDGTGGAVFRGHNGNHNPQPEIPGKIPWWLRLIQLVFYQSQPAIPMEKP